MQDDVARDNWERALAATKRLYGKCAHPGCNARDGIGHSAECSARHEAVAGEHDNPVQGSREHFEAAYEQAAKQLGAELSPLPIMRNGEGYGQPSHYLNGAWHGWQLHAKHCAAWTCAHDIRDARNAIVKSGYICIKCGALFAGAHNEPSNPELVDAYQAVSDDLAKLRAIETRHAEELKAARDARTLAQKQRDAAYAALDAALSVVQRRNVPPFAHVETVALAEALEALLFTHGIHARDGSLRPMTDQRQK